MTTKVHKGIIQPGDQDFGVYSPDGRFFLTKDLKGSQVPGDAQAVFVSTVDGRILGVDGGPDYVVGGKQHDFTRKDREAVADLMDGVNKGEVQVFTPSEFYEAHRDKTRIFYTSGGEASGISPFITEFIKLMGDDKLSMIAMHGFGTGVLPPEKFKRFLIALNDPQLLKELGGMGGSLGGMARESLIKESKDGIDESNLAQFCDNNTGVDGEFGTGGGDHSNNFIFARRRSVERGSPVLTIHTDKTVDGDTAYETADGRDGNMLSLGFLSAAYKARVRFFDEFYSSAGYLVDTHRDDPEDMAVDEKVFVARIFGRGASGIAYGATRTDPQYLDGLVRQNLLAPSTYEEYPPDSDEAILNRIFAAGPQNEKEVKHLDLRGKMDRLGGRVITLLSEFPCGIDDFLERFDDVYTGGGKYDSATKSFVGGKHRVRTAGVACAEGFMFDEVNGEFWRLRQGIEGGSLKGSEVRSQAKIEALHLLVEDTKLREVFQKHPKIAEEFFNEVLNPKKDIWGHPKLGFMPKLVDAIIKTFRPIKKTDYTDITYEVRTAEPIPDDIVLANRKAKCAFEAYQRRESGMVVLPFARREDQLLVNVANAPVELLPHEGPNRILKVKEDNNLSWLDPDYIRRTCPSAVIMAT